MAGSSEAKALVQTLLQSREAVASAAATPEQQRLIGPILAEVDRAIAAIEPGLSAGVPLTPLSATAPVPAEDVEAQRRGIERERALEADPRGLLDAVLNQSPHGVIVSDATGRLTLQNRAAERIWAGSATADTVEGWGQYRAFHDDGRPYEPGDWAMARCLSMQERIDAEEVHFQRFDGTHGILLGSAAPVFGPGGEIVGAVSTFADITHFKQLERALRLSEAWLSTTLRSIADAVIATDEKGRVQFLNAVAESLVGHTMQEAKGRPIHELFRIVDEQTGEAAEGPVSRVLQKGAVVALASAKLVRADGLEMLIEHSGAPLRNEAGDLIGVVVVFRDVTEKRRAEERRHFIGEASMQLACLSLDYESTLASVARLAVPRLCDFCLVDLAEADGSLTCAAVAPADLGRARLAHRLEGRHVAGSSVAREILDVMQGGQPELTSAIVGRMADAAAADDPAYEEILRRLGRGAAMTVPLRGRDRSLGALTFVAVESGRRFGPDDVALAQQLGNCAALAIDNARLYREAQRVNRIKDEFLATLSHELRTPLNAILGWSRLLRMGKLDDRGRARAIETIERNAQSQAQLIEDLLDVSRIISGKFRVEVRSVNLEAVIEAAIDAVRLAAEAKSITLRPRLDGGGARVAGDPTRLQQVVWNLLSNAIKFTPKGGHVEVRLARVDAHLDLEVIDDGQGIPGHFLPYVFDRFRQADGTTTRTHTGLGLGLAIVRHLVELHGGVVRADSDGEGRGSTFAVRLPVASARPRAPEAVFDERARSAAEPAFDESRPLQGLSVLVVDDETDARELVTTVLAENGAGVTAVASVTEALEAIQRRRPDVLVSDIAMPTEDGYALIRRVRALEKTLGHIPAAALTAYASAQDRTRALLAGYTSHLPKPIEPAELTAVVANLAGRTARG